MRPGGHLSSKSAVEGAFEELNELPGVGSFAFRTGPWRAARLVKLLGEVGAFVSLYKWDAARWLEGDLHAEITRLPAGGVSMKLCSNMGYGLCDAVFPAVRYAAISFDEVRWIMHAVPELAGPLRWWFDGNVLVMRLPDHRTEVIPAPPVSDAALLSV